MFLKILQISQENTRRPGGLQLYQRETPIQMFSCEVCEVFMNNYFEEHLRTTSSNLNLIINYYGIEKKKKMSHHEINFLLESDLMALIFSP